MSPFLARLYATYDQHYHAGLDPALQAGASRSYAAEFADLVDSATSGALLDVGCGSGLLLHWLATRAPQAQLHGVDSSLPMIELSKKRLPPGVQLHHADGITFLRTHPGAFVGIFATDILEHLDDDALTSFLDGALDALAPGGFLVVKVPNMANLSAAELRYRDATHQRGFTEKSLRQCFDAFGYVATRCRGMPADSTSMRLRQWLESLLHRLVFRICGHGDVTIFTRTITAVGRRGSMPQGQP